MPEVTLKAKNIVIEVVDSDGEAHNMILVFSEYPPELHRFMILELFREALRAISDDKYRLDIIPRDLSGGSLSQLARKHDARG